MCARYTYEVVAARVVRPDGRRRVCGLDDLCRFFAHTLWVWELQWYWRILHRIIRVGFSPLGKPLALLQYPLVEARLVLHLLPLSCVNQSLVQC